jgi:small subunit ribosomal protein S7
VIIVKVFGKWDPAEVEVTDPSVKGYMNLASKAVMHSGGKHAKQQFKKSEQHIVERLVNKLMRKEKNTGKKLKTYGIVEGAFDIVAKRTKENPLSVLAKAVDTSPQRRVDTALMFLAKGTHAASFKKAKKADVALADEIISAANRDVKSYAINHRDSVERVAKAAR